MEDDLLLVIHAGYYIGNVGWDDSLKERYGDYNRYLKKLCKGILSRKNSIFLPHKKDDLPPFDLPEGTETIDDEEILIETLKKREVTAIDICGEFLWYYGRIVGTKEIMEVAKSLPPRKRKMIENKVNNNEDLDFRLLNKQGIDTKPFLNLFESAYEASEILDGCVKHIRYKLGSDFSVNIVRGLCYPIKEPKQLNHEI